MTDPSRLIGGLAESIVRTVREPLLVLDGALRVVVANQAFYRTFGVNLQETENTPASVACAKRRVGGACGGRQIGDPAALRDRSIGQEPAQYLLPPSWQRFSLGALAVVRAVIGRPCARQYLRMNTITAQCSSLKSMPSLSASARDFPRPLEPQLE